MSFRSLDYKVVMDWGWGKLKDVFWKDKFRVNSEGFGGVGRVWINVWLLNFIFNMLDNEEIILLECREFGWYMVVELYICW